MTNDIKIDYLELIKFLSKYNLNSLLKNSKFVESLKCVHKKYFCLLLFYAELSESLNSKKTTQKQDSYLKESCSDIGITLFLIVNGAYKPAKILLRGSIETFLKGFCIDYDYNIVNEKNVFKLFDKTKAMPFFKVKPQKDIYNSIHNDYKLLCKDVHTASLSHMQNITALKYFPTYTESQVKTIYKIYDRLATNYLLLLVIKYNNIFRELHYRNKKTVIINIPRMHRQLIHGLE